MTLVRPVFLIITLVSLTQAVSFAQIYADTLKTVRMTAQADHQSANLIIQWKDDPGINTYSLYKKTRQDTTWGNALIVTGDQDTSYLDTDIEEGKLYEYRIVKKTGDTEGYGYLFSGVNFTPPQKKGDILLLTESIAADLVADKLTEYMNVLTSEGWKPWLVSVTAAATPQEVKSLILEYSENLDSLNTVLLLGNIAVPHSGDINPDAHANHKGAWPADVYYGDIDGIWTDESVNNISSAYPRLHNIPGDGNFDQDFIPGEIELVIGRLDFSELPVFDLDQYELLENYLDKNIAYRTGMYQPRRRAMIINLNPWTEGLAQNGIRNFVPIVSADSIDSDNFFTAFQESYLWSYGGSSGSMTNSNGLGSINTYADNNFQVIFSSYFGSYFGDYDFENNYLRTILASGKVLSTAWVGAPNWHFHPMGLGLDLGFCTLLTQNNTDLYYAGYFPQSVTINLLGDPTLQAFIVLPPHNLTAVQNGNNMELSWSSSEDEILGYQVYKKSEEMDYFVAINPTPISNTSLIDSCVLGGKQIQYLVKAVKREITPSGSFINHSNGSIISVQTNPIILPTANFNLSWEQGILSGTNLSTEANQYQWLLPNGSSIFEENFEIPYNQNGETSVSLIAANDCFSDTLQQVIIIADILNLQAYNEINIYPNPTQQFITLETTAHIDELQLYNVFGMRLQTESNLAPGLHIIDLQNLATGNYLLKIQQGNQLISKVISKS